MKSWARLGHLIVGLGLISSAHADIYSYSDDDGTIVLSNSKMNNRAAILIREAGAQATARLTDSAGRSAQYQQVVLDVARVYGVDSALIHAVISVESGYSVRAVSSKGAAGLMQLMPATARRYGVIDSFDPVQNLHAGAQYLRDLLDMFNGDISLALAAYNAGENAVVRAGRRIPPFQETKDYVRKVQSSYAEYKSRHLRPD